MQDKPLFFALAIGAIFLLRCALEPIEMPSYFQSEAVAGFGGEYVDSIQKVHLSWQPVAQQSFHFYRIYRSSTTDTYGSPIGFASEGAQRRIASGAHAFDDVVGLTDNTYYYRICIVSIGHIAVSAETTFVEGPLSAVASCTIRSGVSFSINDGDLFVEVDTCDLVVRDGGLSLRSVRFADPAAADSLPPRFGVRSPLDSTISPDKTMRRYRWALPKGGGTKIVFAEQTYTNGNRDTVYDDINIKPYRVKFMLRNNTQAGTGSMIVNPGGLREYSGLRQDFLDDYRIFRPRVEFSVSIFNDMTFEPEFEYWLLLHKSSARLGSLRDERIGSSRRSGKLTEYGPMHDDSYVYRYMFDPDSAKANPMSESAQNLRAVLSAKGDTIVKLDTTTFADIFQRLVYLSPDGLMNAGRKEISIVARFKGRYFNDTREVVSSAALDTMGTSFTFLDFYQPRLIRDAWDFQHYPVYEDGSTVTGSFTLRIDTCQDLGGARVKKIQLLISAMPDSLAGVWTVFSNPISSSFLTIDMLTSWRHRILPIDIAIPKAVVSPVEWAGIDMTGWPSGKYLFGIITEDEFGNRGFAPIVQPGVTPERSRERGALTNPFHLNVNTGVSEL